MKQGSYVERYVDAMACLKKAPRTVPELCEVVGMSEAPMIRLVKAMHSEGLIEPFGFMPRKPHQSPHDNLSAPARTVWMWSK